MKRLEIAGLATVCVLLLAHVATYVVSFWPI